MQGRERVKAYRKSLGMTQGQFAEHISKEVGLRYTTSLVSYAEKGIVDFPENVVSWCELKTAEKPFRNGSVASKDTQSIYEPFKDISFFKSTILPEVKKLTQEERVLEYIKEFGSITTWEAFADLGITRLSAKIFDLDKLGYKFDRKTEISTNRYGKKVHYTRYSLRTQDGTENVD